MKFTLLLLLGGLAVAQDQPVALQDDPLVRHTRFIVNRVQAFNDPQERIIALSRVAAVVCKRDRAEGVALFESDMLLLKVFELDRPVKKGDRAAQSKRDSLHRELRDRMNRCDSSLAKRILSPAPVTPEQEAQESNISAMRSAAQAVRENAEDSDVKLKAVISGIISASGPGLGMGMGQDISAPMSFLRQLQTQNQALASKVFMDTLAQVRGKPQIDIPTLIGLGGYVFAAKDAPGDGGMFATIGGVPLQVLSQIRDTATPEMAAAYLDVALSILNQPGASGVRAKYVLAAGKLLSPLAQQYLPDRAPAFDSALQLLAAENPQPAPKREYDLKKEKDLDSSDEEAEIMALPNTEERDKKLQSLATMMCFRKNFARAQDLNSKIKDSEIRLKLEILINFQEGVEFIAQRKFEDAQADAARLQPSTERCLLLLGIAKGMKAKDTHPNVNTCLLEVSKIPPSAAPGIQVAAAEVAAITDAKFALAPLRLAVAGYNRFFTEGKTDFSSEFSRSTGNRGSGYSLIVPGITTTIEPAIAALMKTEPDETETIVSILQDEAMLGRALATVLDGRQQLAPKPAKPAVTK